MSVRAFRDRLVRSARSTAHCVSVLPIACTLVAVASTWPDAAASAGPYTDVGHPPQAMLAWADSVEALVRGPIDHALPGSPLASFGSAASALGVAAGNSLDVVSLGDGGSLTLGLEDGIHNGPGDDFAVYENGIELGGFLFAELAFVEVSSNGFDFARFPVTTGNPFPVASFDLLDPSDYSGLAGRHALGLGTGFDLADLAGDPLVASGAVDLQAVRAIRVIDVVGDGTRLDDDGRPIFDPYPTAFASGGFDLEAVGARHVAEPGLAAGLGISAAGLALASPAPRRRTRTRRSPSRGALRRSSGIALLAALIGLALTTPAAALLATFDDLGLAPNSFENGAGQSGGFTSGGVFFENDYDATFGVFSGFAASTVTDATTPGFGNQFGNITGGGANASAGFGIAYSSSSRIVLPEPQIVLGGYFTNTTYAALSMRDGDAFAKRFGGATGDDPDFFRLVVEGIDALGQSTGTRSLLLADYRFADPAQDYVVDEWVFLDLVGLGSVRELRFDFESSDVGAFGINTPTYFAIDDLTTIPEPAPALLLGFALAGLAARPHDTRQDGSGHRGAR